MKKLLSMILALALVLSMVSLAAAESALPYAEGTVLRMATGYNNAKTGLRFDPKSQAKASPWPTAKPTMPAT